MYRIDADAPPYASLDTPAGPVPAGQPWWNPQRASQMPHQRYRRPARPVELPDRTWPTRTLHRAPLWCSVDLRDGNQSLPRPMNQHRKEQMFQLLVRMGFKEIEVGYPSASSTDFDFVRHLIDDDLIPDDVTISVFTPARPELIERTFDSIRGADRAMVHLCNAVAPLWRDVVFGLDQEQTLAMATNAARVVLRLADAMPETETRFEYSPEVFNLTEPEYALRVCDSVSEIWEASPDRPVTVNLPTTVEAHSPNLFADQVEWMHRRLRRRSAVILSVHPHNDRGTGVASAELALLAGADRVEGCLFGNGERTGNVCLPTLALNLFSSGIDPQLDFSDIDGIRGTVEYCNKIAVHDRHPYVGDYVYTAFSGTHQDAIHKGLVALDRVAERRGTSAAAIPWNVPYLPVDPKDVGRSYESVVRVNSQSGKGGIAYVLSSRYGLRLPRGLQVELSKVVQSETDSAGEELTAKELWELFCEEYLATRSPLTLGGLEAVSDGGGDDAVAAYLDGARRLGHTVELDERSSHEVTDDDGTRTAVYLRVVLDGRPSWGVGLHRRPEVAAASAVVSAVNRAVGPAE
jgi:2-isopropylmalate synthase